ncbi:MAG: RNA recognition motif domain-containing protein [Waterburya sp.]
MDLYVGSLPFKFKEKDLMELFSPFGEVKSAKIVIDKTTRQNKGFGFVEMAKEPEARKAMQALDGSDQMGRAIIVSVAEKNSEGNRISQKPRQWNKTGKKKDDVLTWGE